MAISKIENNSLASGVPGRSNLPAGTVLQVVNATYSTLTSTASSGWSDTGLTASITPSSATSKVLVFVNMAGITKNANSINGGFQLVRNSTVALVFEGLATYTASTAVSTGSANCNYLDSPASTSAVTYKVQFKIQTSSAGTLYINNYDAATSASTITLMEIAA